MRIDLSGQAFPYTSTIHLGITKRELFAAMAMLGQIPVEKDTDLGKVAAWSVQYADELIAALDRVEKTAAPAIVEQVVRP